MGCLAPLLALLDEHDREDFPAAAKNAVDVAAGTAVYTTAFAEHFPWLQFHASDRLDPGSTIEYPTGFHQTREALCAIAAECDPVEMVDDRKLLFVSEGPCAVREGDVGQLQGLQQRPALNGQLGLMCKEATTSPGASSSGRFGVQLLESATSAPMAIMRDNLRFERPGWVGASMSSPSGMSGGDAWQAREIERLRSEVRRLIKREVVRGVRVCDLDVASRATWQPQQPLYGTCALVTCMRLLSQVGFEQPTLWQPLLELASLLLAPGGICMRA